MIRYQVAVTNQLGVIQAVITNFQKLSYVIRGDSAAGGFTMTVDRVKYESIFTPSNVDWRVQIYRQVNDFDFALEGRTEFFIEVIDITDATITVSGSDLQSIIARRVNAYASQRTGFAFSDNADDICKQVVRNNFITALSGRDGSATNFSLSSYITVDPDNNACPSISFAASRDNCLDIIKSVCDTSTYISTWLCARIISSGTLPFIFRTFPISFGLNQQSLVLSRESRNIENIRIVYDRSEEVTSAIVGGVGEGLQRIIGTSDNATSISLSPFYRKEYFYSNPQISTTGDANNYAFSLLRARRATVQFSADILNSNFFVRGIDFNLGDIITVQFLQKYYVCRLNVVYVYIQGTEIQERGELNLI
jgi:hypothetical protein